VFNKGYAMKTIFVKIKDRGYPIIVGHGILPRLGHYAASLEIGSDAVIITNKAVKKLYGPDIARAFSKKKISVKFLEVPDGEKSKSQQIAFDLIGKIARYDVQKKIFIVALGGGVIGDLAGFVAAIYKRGVPLVQVPTTFLAQIDSAIGGKTAIDLSVAKNLVGAFYQPRLVVSDVATLTTLSLRQLRNGLAEAVKYGAIKDKALFAYLERYGDRLLLGNVPTLTHVVEICSAIKARIVEKDEKETRGLRTILNFGHTIGHGIETASTYGHYQHGEAVALGMRVAAAISSGIGLCSCADRERLEALLTQLGLPQQIQRVKPSAIINSMAHDKKNISKKNRFVLIKDIGSATVVQGISWDVVKEALQEYTF